MESVIERIVVDTNVFISALRSANGGSRQVLRLCLKGEVKPLMGNKLFLEYLDVLARPELFATCPIDEPERAALLEGFLAMCKWTDVFFLWRPNLPDEGDNHLIELAVAGGAGIVVTHNLSDFRGELRFPMTQVLTPAQFLKMKR